MANEIQLFTWPQNINTDKPVYKGHSREPEMLSSINSCPLYTGFIYMHYLLIGKMRLSLIDSDLPYRGAL
jgi:hypothetical protein